MEIFPLNDFDDTRDTILDTASSTISLTHRLQLKMVELVEVQDDSFDVKQADNDEDYYTDTGQSATRCVPANRARRI
jgi:hypothetical protein